MATTNGATIRLRSADGMGWERRKLLRRNDTGTGWEWMQVASTATEVIVDDKTTGTGNLQWDFSSGWATTTSEHYSSTTSSTATLRFQGTSAVIYGKRNTHHGKMSVSIDGGPATEVDCYAATSKPEALLFDSGVLADSAHTIVCTVTGTKNASSTDYVVALDYAKVMSTATETTPVTSAALPWAPPNVAWTVTHVSNATIPQGTGTSTITFNAGTDNHVIFDEPLTRRLRIAGGRNLKIVGGEWNINVDNASGDLNWAENHSNNGGFEPVGQTGTVFLEGVLIHGPYALDSIRSSDLANADLVIQNSRLVCDRVLGPVATPSKTNDVYHTDGVQLWGGVKSLKMYNVTICNPYQGGMFGDGNLLAVWGPTYLENVNYQGGPTIGTAWKMFNWVKGKNDPTYLTGPFTFKGDTVMYQPGPGVEWNTTFAELPTSPPYTPYAGGALYSSNPPGTDAQGRIYAGIDTTNYPNVVGFNDGNGGPLRIYKGVPAEGDYCPVGVAGVGYVSPGYVI